MSETAPDKLLEVRDLRTHFHTFAGTVKAVNGVSFDIAAGEVMGLVGESGGGKSVVGFSILGLIDSPGKIEGGEILLDLSSLPHGLYMVVVRNNQGVAVRKFFI